MHLSEGLMGLAEKTIEQIRHMNLALETIGVHETMSKLGCVASIPMQRA